MKQPDRDLTSKTLQEMANLYQELLEKNLTCSSYHATAKNLNSLHESIQLGSAASILIPTERKNLPGQHGHVSPSSQRTFLAVQRQKNEEGVLPKGNEGSSKIKAGRGSFQVDPRPLINQHKLNVISQKSAA